MTDLSRAAVAETAASTPATPAPDGVGWYLYGITRRDAGGIGRVRPGDEHPADAERPLDDAPGRERLRLLERGSLAAVVRSVSLGDFTGEVLQARLGDPALLEAMVRMHNAVIADIHQERAILPSRFGSVYARLDDVAAAIEQRHDELLAQLAWLDGCDEWAVHIHVDPRAVHARARAEQAADPVHQELTAARPGRAYFLRRKLEEDLAARTAQLTEELAHAAYQRFARLAVAVQAERPTRPSDGLIDEIEVLRAAVLVQRERRDELIAQLHAGAQDQSGWRYTYSGPWPPYSFAAFAERGGDDHHGA